MEGVLGLGMEKMEEENEKESIIGRRRAVIKEVSK